MTGAVLSSRSCYAVALPPFIRGPGNSSTIYTESTGSRFLRARKFDLPKAKEMLLNAEQWRIDFKVDEIVQNFEFKEKAEVDKYYPQFYHNTDKVTFLRSKKINKNNQIRRTDDRSTSSSSEN